MKKKIIEVIFESHNLALLALKDRLEGATGDYNYYYPREDGKDSNILLVEGVSVEFLDAIRELHEEEILETIRTNPLIVAHDSGHYYRLKVALDVRRTYKKLRWLPVIIKKGPNFPKNVELTWD